MFDHSLDSVDLLLDLCHPEELRFELTAHVSELLVDPCEHVCAVRLGASRAARASCSGFSRPISETTDTAGASHRAVMNRHCYVVSSATLSRGNHAVCQSSNTVQFCSSRSYRDSE